MEKTGSKLTDKTDAQLVEMALKGGDSQQNAYMALYTRYHAGVRGHISRFVQNQEEIEDICMESFEKAFKQLATYKPENKFSTWMLTIARNTAFDHNDKDKVRGRKVDSGQFDVADPEAVSIPDDAVSPEDAVINSQTHEKFLTCIEGLPDLYRDAARLCFVDNLGYKEISEQLDLPLNTVKTRIRRSRSILTEMMQGNDDE